jgi:hypothetical protein
MLITAFISRNLAVVFYLLIVAVTGIARNSWGPSFADKGYFRIKYGVCGVAGPGDTYG